MIDFKTFLDIKNYDIFIFDTDICFKSDAVFVITRSFIQRLKQLTIRKMRYEKYKDFLRILKRFNVNYIERDYNELRIEKIDLEKIKNDVLEPKDRNPKWIIVNKCEFIPLLRYYLPFRLTSTDLLYTYSKYLSNSTGGKKMIRRRIEVL